MAFPCHCERLVRLSSESGGGIAAISEAWSYKGHWRLPQSLPAFAEDSARRALPRNDGGRVRGLS